MVTGWNEFTNGGSEVTSNTPSWPVAGTYSTVVGDLQFGKVASFTTLKTQTK